MTSENKQTADWLKKEVQKQQLELIIGFTKKLQ